MGMRLLTKTDIQQKKAGARKLEIDEGKKLSQSVDRLRELKVFEEKSLEAFRVRSISAIHSEIKKESRRRDVLRKEVKALEEKRAEALKPLDAEWQIVNDEKILLGDRLELVKDREKAVYTKEAEVEATTKEAKKVLDHATTKSTTATKMLKKALAREVDTKKLHEQATKIRNDATAYKEDNEKVLLKREDEVAVRERTVELKLANITDDKAKLEAGWKLLNDRTAKLERNLKRLKK